MLKREIAVILSGLVALGMCAAYAEEPVSLGAEQTVSTPAEENLLVINSDDIEFSAVPLTGTNEIGVTANNDGEQPVINEDKLVDELENKTYMYECKNFKPYSEISPDNAALFDDKTLMSFETTDKEAYIIYKAAESRSFKSLYIENYTRDGGKNADVLVSSDGVNYISLNPVWKKLGPGGSEQDALWSDRNAYTVNFSEENNVRFIKIFKTGESAVTKYKIGNVTVETYDMLKGCVPDGEYEEGFETTYNINEFKDVRLDNVNHKLIAEKADSAVIYKSLPQKALKTIEFITDGEWKGSIEALDINKRKSELKAEPTVEKTDGGSRVTVELPNDAAYVKLVGTAVYSKIVINSDSAVGHEWTFTGGAAEFTPATLQGGGEVSFKIPVKNMGCETQSLKAFACVYEGDRMDKIQEVQANVSGGTEVNIEGKVALDTVTGKTSVRIFVWSDIGTMIPFGDESVLGAN